MVFRYLGRSANSKIINTYKINGLTAIGGSEFTPCLVNGNNKALSI